MIVFLCLHFTLGCYYYYYLGLIVPSILSRSASSFRKRFKYFFSSSSICSLISCYISSRFQAVRWALWGWKDDSPEGLVLSVKHLFLHYIQVHSVHDYHMVLYLPARMTTIY